ncbi:MAG: hypothetical protein AAF533_23920 [Acidobacteriota bacterium]
MTSAQAGWLEGVARGQLETLVPVFALVVMAAASWLRVRPKVGSSLPFDCLAAALLLPLAITELALCLAVSVPGSALLPGLSWPVQPWAGSLTTGFGLVALPFLGLTRVPNDDDTSDGPDADGVAGLLTLHLLAASLLSLLWPALRPLGLVLVTATAGLVLVVGLLPWWGRPVGRDRWLALLTAATLLLMLLGLRRGLPDPAGLVFSLVPALIVSSLLVWWTGRDTVPAEDQSS